MKKGLCFPKRDIHSKKHFTSVWIVTFVAFKANEDTFNRFGNELTTRMFGSMDKTNTPNNLVWKRGHKAVLKEVRGILKLITLEGKQLMR